MRKKIWEWSARLNDTVGQVKKEKLPACWPAGLPAFLLEKKAGRSEAGKIIPCYNFANMASFDLEKYLFHRKFDLIEGSP